MNKAVFLDRDGVINSPADNYYVWKSKDFIPNKGIIELAKELQRQEYLLIVITNQGGVAKGLYTKGDVMNFHSTMCNYFEKNDVKITAAYFCPHHQDIGICFCRKPQGLMLEKAVARFDINVSKSYMIGDSVRDIEAAKSVGIKGIKIEKDKIDVEKILKQL